MYSYSYCACVLLILFALTHNSAQNVRLSRVKKKRQTRRHILNFFLISPLFVQSWHPPNTHLQTRKGEKEDGFFRFFCFLRVHSSALLNTRPRRRSQEPTERVDVCLSQQQKRHRFHSLLVYSFIIYRVFIIIIYELFIQQREREKETRV